MYTALRAQKQRGSRYFWDPLCFSSAAGRRLPTKWAPAAQAVWLLTRHTPMPKLATSADRPPTAPASLLRFLDPPTVAWRWGICETVTLALYSAVIAFGIHQHIPWADESQAWMLAHEVSLPTLLVHNLHYEGTPGLWHVLLKLLQLLHFSFTAARWVAGGIAAAGTAVLLAYAPFPRIIRLLLPFSFFLAYQDAVIARSYVLFAIVAFTAAALLRSNRTRPLQLALILGLMANISLHALLASGALAIVAVTLWRHHSDRPRRPLLPAILLLLLFWTAAITTMAPARDVDFSAGNNVWRSLCRLENQLGIPAVAPPSINSLHMAGLPRAPLPTHLHAGPQQAWHKLARTLAVITYPLATYRWLALLLGALVAAQSRRLPGSIPPPSSPTGPIGLVPYLVLVVIFTSLYLEPRHAGMVFTTFVVAAWLTWPTRTALTSSRLILERTTTAVFALVLVLQISWTAQALHSEHTLPYSPDKMTADYLQQRSPAQGPAPTAGFYYYSIGPLLYFHQNIYANQPPHRYWLWSTETRSYTTAPQILTRHPNFIVIGGYQPGPDAEITRDWLPNTPPEPGIRLGDAFFISNYFHHHGYRETHLFCGHSWMRTTWSEQDCASILEPTPAAKN